MSETTPAAPPRPGETVPLGRLIARVQRDLRLHSRVYPDLVSAGTTSVLKAAREAREMQRTLEALQELAGSPAMDGDES
jgi:hypothetical protein